jgi:predicted phage tail protein
MILENVSSQANTVLQQAGILPKEFPKEMIDAAIQSEGAGTISNRAPGVLHLMLELERKDQQGQSHPSDDENEVMQLAIVRLRVGELEFSAPSLNTKRRTLRNLEQQLQQLDEQYRKLTRERAIAQAELAWRSSWHEG